MVRSEGKGLAPISSNSHRISDTLKALNITLPGGMLEVGSKNVKIDPSGEFRSEKDIGNVIITTTESGTPLYLRDLVEIVRDYEKPPAYLNFFTVRDNNSLWLG